MVANTIGFTGINGYIIGLTGCLTNGNHFLLSSYRSRLDTGRTQRGRVDPGPVLLHGREEHGDEFKDLVERLTDGDPAGL